MRQGSFEAARTCLLALFLAITGPFVTWVIAPLSERLGYWLTVTLLAYVACRTALNLADRGTTRAPRLVRRVARMLAIMLASALLTGPVWLASYLHAPRLWPTPWDLVDLFPSVLVVAAMVSAVLLLVERMVGAPRNSIDQGQAALAVRARPAFVDRLPGHLGNDLLALEMEDHYVRAHAAEGSALILMRMRDAVSELAGLEGAQVHRSWWVAETAVRRIGGTGRAPRLELTNGLVVPVARDRRQALRDLRR